MANPEHVALVHQGAEAIAEWRKAHPAEHLDLKEADLRGAQLWHTHLKGADLRSANLRDADFRGADLERANLREADLRGANLEVADITGADLSHAHLDEANLYASALSSADLSGSSLPDADLYSAYLDSANLSSAHLYRADLGDTKLNEADLSRAYLFRADLSGADLSNASLRGADLREANLSGADLSGTDLSRARFDRAYVGNVDLSRARGLKTVEHLGPSSVGADTLIVSFRGAGNRVTPALRAFFRGAGVPQPLLDSLSGFVAKVKHHSCLISYGRPDRKFAKKLRQDLQDSGVSCWLYEMDEARTGSFWREFVEDRRAPERFVVLCSAAALVREGVLNHLGFPASEDPERLVSISLDNLWKEPGFRIMRGTHDLKADLTNRNYADFANKPYKEALEELLKGLRREKPADRPGSDRVS